MRQPKQSVAAACQQGITLLELTVVILVILSLVSILFIGAMAWKRGSDRAACIMNLQAVQKAVRSYSNLNNYNPGETVSGLRAKVVGTNLFVAEPVCPRSASGSGYTDLGDMIPSVGSLYMSCNLATSADHTPDNIADW